MSSVTNSSGRREDIRGIMEIVVDLNVLCRMSRLTMRVLPL